MVWGFVLVVEPRSRSGVGGHGPDPVLREVFRRHLRVQVGVQTLAPRSYPPLRCAADGETLTN